MTLGHSPLPFPHPVRAVLFDLDGVLVDSGRAWHRVVARGAKQFGCPEVTWEQFRPTFGQGPEADQRDFFPGVSVEEVVRHYDATFPEELPFVEVMPGAQAALGRLAELGIARAVVTNTPRALALEVLARVGLQGALDAVAAAGEAAEKPAPDLVLLALERLGHSPSEAIYVGDSESDRAAARAAGVFMVGFGREGDGRIDRLEDLASWVLRQAGPPG